MAFRDHSFAQTFQLENLAAQKNLLLEGLYMYRNLHTLHYSNTVTFRMYNVHKFITLNGHSALHTSHYKPYIYFLRCHYSLVWANWLTTTALLYSQLAGSPQGDITALVSELSGIHLEILNVHYGVCKV